QGSNSPEQPAIEQPYLRIEPRKDKEERKQEVGDNGFKDVFQVAGEDATRHSNTENKATKDGVDPNRIGQPATQHYQHQDKGQQRSSNSLLPFCYAAQMLEQRLTDQ